MPVAKDLRLGERGEEVAGWLWRLGGLTLEQYARLAAPADNRAVEAGQKGRATQLVEREDEGGSGESEESSDGEDAA